MRLIGKIGIAYAAAAGLLVMFPPEAGATPFANSDSSVTNENVDPSGTVEDYEPSNPASSVEINSSNYAKSQLDPSTYTGGAAAGASVGGTSETTTRVGNDWFLACSLTNPCEDVSVSTPVPIALTISLSGTMSQSNTFSDDVGNYSYIDYQVQYTLGNGGRFSFEINQDNDDPQVQATYQDASGQTSDLAYALTLAGGVYSFSVDATIDDAVTCNPDSPCTPVVCDTCAGPPLFTDLGYLNAEVDGYQGQPGFVDGLDPFSVSVVSLDPDFTLFNDGPTPAPSPAPEPGSLALLASAFGGLALTLRRRRRPIA